jgi:hypothetical protein
MYNFYKQYSKEKILSIIKLETKKLPDFTSTDCIVSIVKGNRIRLQKRNGIIRHPFQRYFVGKVCSNNNSTTISGKFRSSSISIFCSAIFLFYMAYNHIRALITIEV